MARRALGPARLRLVGAVEAALNSTDTALLVACSGGADSLALAGAARVVAGRRGLSLAAAVIDHGLQTDSALVAKRAARQLTGLGVTDVRVRRVTVADDGHGPEAAAREARYAALRAEASPDGLTVLLGHTLDDQAETVLLGLARGSGPRSLAGMAARAGVFLRPLLGVPRAVTAAACTELGLQPWTDPHNTDPSYARGRVRSTILPVLEAELGGGVAAALARTAALARDDADLLDRLAAEAQESVLVRADRDRTERDGAEPDCAGRDWADLGGADLDSAALAVLPAALRRRILRNWLTAAGGRDLGHVHLIAVDALVTDWHGQGPIDVPGLSVRRTSGRLTPVRRAAPGPALGGVPGEP